MTAPYTAEEIRRYWTSQVATHGQSPSASWSDRMAIELEIRNIAAHLRDGDRVLDVGCGNGYSTVRFAASRNLTVRGLDYIPEMVDQARARLAGLPALATRVAFAVGDITSLPEPSDTYDAVVVTRVVINLPSWEAQLRGIGECVRVTRPGGLFLMSEATLQGWRRLNDFRGEWGLPPIPMPAFNRYLDEEAVVEAVGGKAALEGLENFASSYFVGTRVLKPLLAQALGSAVDVADPEMHWNQWFAALPPTGDYGTQKLFVFRKRA